MTQPEDTSAPPRRRRGPNTNQGKARSSRNALKHGILSPHPIIIEEMESEEEWDDFRDGIIESLAPVGRLEEELAQSIAFTRWRLRRVVRFEAAVINVQVQYAELDVAIADRYLAEEKQNVPDPDPQRVAVQREKSIIPTDSALDRITRFEAHLHRLWQQTYREFEAIQARRHGERPHLARVSVDVSPRGTVTTPPKLDIPDFLQKDAP